VTVWYTNIKKGQDVFCVKKLMAFLSVFLIFSLSVCSAYAQDSTVKVYVNGMRVKDDGFLSQSTTFVPLRAVSEALGANVVWDGNTNSVFVTFTEEDAIAQIVEDVSPSVVTIIGNYSGSGYVNQYNNFTSHGSGVIYKSNGYIVTNAHVVEEIKNLTVVMSDGTSMPGKILYSDKN